MEDAKEAKIVWLSFDYALSSYKIDKSKVYINQFNHEAALVNKAHLANMVYSTLIDTSCIMETYDLETKLPCFIGAFLER